MKIIVGLGNPGKEYEHTRHNIGWDIVSLLAKKEGARFSKKTDLKAEIAEWFCDREKVLLVHPLTFMNASGEAVSTIQHFYKCPTENILIVQDEMDYPLETFAFTRSAGPAGHNGIASIQEILGTKQIARLRIGINRPTDPMKKESYVLQPFGKEEKKLIEERMTQAADAIKDWIAQGTSKAMEKWNGNGRAVSKK